MLYCGIGVLFYPAFSNCWNQHVSYKSIIEYSDAYGVIPEEEKDVMLEKAQEYNQSLLKKGEDYISECVTKLSGASIDAQRKGEVLHPDTKYESLLSRDSADMMGYLSIPAIDVNLPIRHYTSENVLADSIGHVYGSSLPVGGKSTHSVLAGHSALSSARLFTDLEKIKIGDEFSITSAGGAIYYQVDQILTVLPEDLSALNIVKGKDYVTLVTCTPYGINSHRLLVRGERVSDKKSAKHRGFYQEEMTTPWYIVHFIPFSIGIFAVLLLILIIVLCKIWKKKKRRKK